MSTPMERATSAGLEWARRAGMTTMRELVALLMALLLRGKKPRRVASAAAPQHVRSWSRQARGQASCGPVQDGCLADGDLSGVRRQREHRGGSNGGGRKEGFKGHEVRS